jgi:hypothetical protein
VANGLTLMRTGDGGHTGTYRSAGVVGLPGRVTDRLSVMRRVRQIAYVILFAGWMLPALLAQNARGRVATTPPDARSEIQRMAGIEPPPTPAQRTVTIFRTIAGVWCVVALIYAGTLTLRLRRTLVS